MPEDEELEEEPDFEAEFRREIASVDDELNTLKSFIDGLTAEQAKITVLIGGEKNVYGAELKAQQAVKNAFSGVFAELKKIHAQVCNLDLADFFLTSVLERKDLSKSVKDVFADHLVKWRKRYVKPEKILDALSRPCSELKDAIKAEFQMTCRIKGEFDKLDNILKDMRLIVGSVL